MGDSDGTVKGEFYFKTTENKALFVKRNQISHIVTTNYNTPRLTIDDVIYMNKFKCKGCIRWIGKLQPYSTLIRYGIELNKAHGTNNGFLNKRICFSNCRERHGVFVTHRDLLDLLIPKRSSLLLYGFLKEEFVPNDIQIAIKSFYNFIHIKYHETINLTIQMERGDRVIGYRKYDVYNMDNCIMMAMRYGATASELKAQLKHVGIEQLNKLRFVERI
eukprot:243646_1